MKFLAGMHFLKIKNKNHGNRKQRFQPSMNTIPVVSVYKIFVKNIKFHLKLFLTKLKDYSGKDVLGYISSRDTRIIESQFDIDLEYVEPEYPSVSGGSGGGGRSEINADKGNYTVFKFTPEESGNYYIYTSPYAGSGVSKKCKKHIKHILKA